MIEGSITDIPDVQTIKISRSVAFDNTNTYPTVNGAKVLVADQAGKQYNFTETAPGIYTFS